MSARRDWLQALAALAGLSEPDTWPSLRIQVELMPWQWRLAYYRDDIEPWCVFLDVGPVKLETWANTPWFRRKKITPEQAQVLTLFPNRRVG